MRFKKVIYLLAIILFISAIQLNAQVKNQKEITVAEGESVRDLAAKYLGDADLWNEILKANNLTSASQIKSGMKLIIPDAVISKANNLIDEALEAITKANEAGAKLFAENEINLAVLNYNNALQNRKEGNYTQSIQQSQTAIDLAGKAFQIASSSRNVSSEAVLTQKDGRVQNRNASASIWNDLQLAAKLSEGDRVRTLANSFAEISFDDGNKIRLNDNAQALIQKMRVDLLKKKKESNVQIVEGDAFALLTGKSSKKDFNVDLEGVETNVNSKNFWVSKKQDKAQIANYDGEIEVTAGGETVIVKRNEGTSVAKGSKPEKPKKLLNAPQLNSPAENEVIYGTTVELTWNNVKGAKEYWLELATDNSFVNVLLFQKGISVTEFKADNLETGLYYWRVAAVDNQGFPGSKSIDRSIKITNDVSAPYLVINYPNENQITGSSEIEVSGITEKGALVVINGIEVDLNSQFEFKKIIELKPGLNEIEIKSEFTSGKESIVKRKVFYDAAENISLTYDPNLVQSANNNFLLNRKSFVFSGITSPNSFVNVAQVNGRKEFNTYSEASGEFSLNISASEETNKFNITVTTVSGKSFSDTLVFLIDENAPAISLDNDASQCAVNRELTLSGSAGDASLIKINGEEVKTSGGKFIHNLILKAGENPVEISAVDKAGNESVIKRNFFYDGSAPIISDYSLTNIKNDRLKIYKVNIEVSDESCVKKSALLKYRYGKYVRSVYLRYNSAESAYQGNIQLPGNISASPKLTSITLEDYSGNKQEYSLTN